jgi:hypothetical protein
VVDEVKNQITLLSPDHLLGPILDSFSQLRNDLLNNDPLQQVLAIIANVKALIAGILEKIKLENILKVPLEIYDYILSELDKVNPNGLIEPILDQLDAIALQVDEGLTETVAAFQRLQASLPGGAGGASAAVSVGV